MFDLRKTEKTLSIINYTQEIPYLCTQSYLLYLCTLSIDLCVNYLLYIVLNKFTNI